MFFGTCGRHPTGEKGGDRTRTQQPHADPPQDHAPASETLNTAFLRFLGFLVSVIEWPRLRTPSEVFIIRQALSGRNIQ
jgi:hypothetical protein